MEAKLFSREELELRLQQHGEIPPIGTQWCEFPPERIPAAVVDHRNGTMSLFLLRSEEDFCERPWGSRLVALFKGQEDFLPQRKPVAKKPPRTPARRQRGPYRNLAAIL